ncbi:sugar transferase [Rhodococcus sp. NPDC059969]|uniref:sugar transferase n=1 Tax=Rhodococcus sp. NPDC059969 TaxID=3347018 RepID=UPI0036733ADC
MRPFALNAVMRSSCFAVEVSGFGKAVRWTSTGEQLRAEFCAWGKVSENMTVLEIAAPTEERPQQHRREAPKRAGGVSARRKWQSAYLRRLAITDTIIVAAVVFLAQWWRFGSDVDVVDGEALGHFSYTALSFALIIGWVAVLRVFRTRSPRVIGSGSEEYRLIAVGTLRLFGLIAIASLLLHLEIARLYLAVAFPVGLTALIASRWIWRRVIARERARGEFRTAVLVVGVRGAVVDLARNFERDDAHGYRVVGVCVPGYGGDVGEVVAVNGRDIPVLGDEHSVTDALEQVGADTVAVTASERLGPEGLRKLAWDLERDHVDLVVAPGILDVSGPRLSMRPVSGFPLIHVERPRYHGAQKFTKTTFDIVFATLVLTVISPVLLAAAIAVKLTSKGPVLYKSERMGLDGQPFPMLKFRSMVQNADSQVTALMKENEGAGVLFKMRDDPRVTTVGRFMRRYSIDELPQFVNVLRREMSVVGPRPPLRREVELYDGAVSRRLLVKPGVTGLWQVSGRSDLSWEDTVRLDLSYVDNWSMMGDVMIVAKTLKAVVGSDGAY